MEPAIYTIVCYGALFALSLFCSAVIALACFARHAAEEKRWRVGRSPAKPHRTSPFKAYNFVPVIGPAKGSHKNVTAYRNAATECVRKYALELYGGVYIKDACSRDIRESMDDDRIRVHRELHTIKDLAMDRATQAPRNGDAVLYLDSDFYQCDFAELHSGFDHLIYSFVPESAGATRENYSYHFDSDNGARFIVAGGGRYYHQLWNWGRDVVWFESQGKITYCKVERKRFEHEHELILLSPIRTVSSWRIKPLWFPSVLGSCMSLFVKDFRTDDTRLDRRQLYHKPNSIMSASPGWIQVDRIVGGQASISFGTVGFPVSVEIDVEILAAMVKNYSWSKEKWVSQIQGLIPGTVGNEQRALVAIGIYDAIRQGEIAWNPDYVPCGEPQPAISRRGALTLVEPSPPRHVVIDIPPPRTGAHYPVGTDNADFVHEASAFDVQQKKVSPVMGTGMKGERGVPSSHIENERNATQTRIEDVRPKEPLKVDSMYYVYMSEFIWLLVSQFGTVVAWGPEQMLAYLNTPRKRADYTRVGQTAGFMSIWTNMFVKAEPTPGKNGKHFGDCRVITATNAEHKFNYQEYLMGIAEKVKSLLWYAFGLAPWAIVRRLLDIAKACRKLYITDFSRWDGRHSLFLAKFEFLLMVALCGQDGGDAVMREWKLRNKTRNGHKYQSWWARLSGSPCTSLFNTLSNALIIFIHYRVAGLSMWEAWDALGSYCIFGGDDGLLGKCYPDILKKVASDIGMKITIDGDAAVDTNHEPIKFLGRIYLQLGSSGNSIIDPARCVANLHIAGQVPSVGEADDIRVAKMLQYRRKAEGLLVTDSNTPIVGDWARAVLRTTSSSKLVYASSARSVNRFWSQMVLDEQDRMAKAGIAGDAGFINQRCPLAVSYTAESLGISVADVLFREEQYRAAKSFEDCFIYSPPDFDHLRPGSVLYKGNLVQ